MRTIKFIRKFIAGDARIVIYNVSDEETVWHGIAADTPPFRVAGTSVDTAELDDDEIALVLYVKNYEDE